MEHASSATRKTTMTTGEGVVDQGDGARGGIDPTTTSNALSAVADHDGGSALSCIRLLAPRRPLVLLDLAPACIKINN